LISNTLAAPWNQGASAELPDSGSLDRIVDQAAGSGRRLDGEGVTRAPPCYPVCTVVLPNQRIRKIVDMPLN
jgi:hypothetical protein